ncbi:hypothetical protein P3X46_027459 [Hevea brasiliensis]|uniref:Pentatricopeptide repeat-containing protein n=1 Tax=Hevea brasiliensis TaxID=3981 RepID=A0ABQ9KZX9_HEVBR|nr:hypothetical protein P3X46_027459 [Hevea brasiliensis]
MILLSATPSKVCIEICDLKAGKLIHGKSVAIGFVLDIIVANSLMSMHCIFGEFRECLTLFGEMPERNASSWNVEIIGSVKYMKIEMFKPGAFTVLSLLHLCNIDIGKMGYRRKLNGYSFGCCLIDMYSRNNKVDAGKQVSDRRKRRNVCVWEAMINGSVQDGALKEALVLFHEIHMKDGVEPKRVSLESVLRTCGSLPGLNWSLCRDAIFWSSMISGHGLHGKEEEAVFVYDRMLQKGNKPDMITVVGVFSACGRSGLVDEGLRIYNSAISEYGINSIKKMPMMPGPSAWGALVNASILHGNLELQNLAYKFLIELEPENPLN